MSSGKKAKLFHGTPVPVADLGQELGPLVKVVVLVSELDSGPLNGPLKGMMDFFDNVGAIFTRGVHQKGVLKAMCTHFALMLHFESGTAVRVERDQEGVHAFQGCQKEDCEFEGRRWGGRIGGLAPLKGFLTEQSRHTYNGIKHNCKHFVYDFFVNVLGHDSNDPFGPFCAWTEDNYRSAVKARLSGNP
mmetsp:Transcript_156523/g.480189  ORF Transcript_156523/g.480189 Transcript_156523/m.480189 type:complete len:189 (-) Transcript_156523:71-637(-)|eukprot:CAMPEP_0204525290 /NCGR_PEP_ID=MMETSP0661-20131031/7831_1 /ASSEMBLY_ACC=CAM_ASM_000606 /TAXON_ID=109239 /ORGANISM="Alexandrium margalefi, Strain AMGDE01CS-322" /LENGTH=188 /DNA_ID=CAMNT_0051531085 /DNA_START=63 /DNA_END=629 /DNA_ORIENTATION=-